MTLRGLEPGTRVALLISEAQRGVIEPGCSPFDSLARQAAERGIAQRIGHLAATFRSVGQPVVHAQVAHRPDYADVALTSRLMTRSARTGFLREDSVDVQPVAEVVPQPGDHVHRRRFSLNAFNGTDLDTALRNLGVRTIVLAGVSSDVAINAIAITGADLGYRMVIPEDCIAGVTAASHAFMVANLLPLYATLTTQAAVEDALRPAPLFASPRDNP